MSYEPELFPALLIDYFKPVHATVFRNGKLIITGLKLEEEIPIFVNKLLHFFHKYEIKTNE